MKPAKQEDKTLSTAPSNVQEQESRAPSTTDTTKQQDKKEPKEEETQEKF